MTDQEQLSLVAAEYRRHFDQYYLGVIPRLLNEEGMFLAFVSMLTAIEALSGAYAPHLNAGERFRKFFAQYFPTVYNPFTEQLWAFRNHMVHAFNPQPFLILCHQSRMHLAEASGVRMLNAEDLYADLVSASRKYFAALYTEPELQQKFGKRIGASDGGGIKSHQIVESIGPHNAEDYTEF